MRTLWRGLLVAVVLPALLAVPSAPAAVAAEQVSLLYSLSGGNATMKLLPGSANRYSFTLTDADPRTVWFSNRPARHSGTLPTSGLVEQWSGLGFTADPPNVAITIHAPTGETDTIVAIMRAPKYNAATGVLRARMQVLSDEQAQSLTGNLARHGDAHDRHDIPTRLGSVSVFIDDVDGTVINGCLIQPYTICIRYALTGASLAGANLTGAQLPLADLSGANLTGANLTAADLTGANLTNTRLNDANLSGASLARAGLAGVSLSGANLSGADLTGVRLVLANLSGQNLSGANLSGADLSGADLSGTNLSGANLSGAELTGARTGGQTLCPNGIHGPCTW